MVDDIVQSLIDKTMRELAQPEKPLQRSRISNTSNGYIHLIAWANASLLRVFVHRFTDPLPKMHHRLKAQLDDAARSTVANIEEGYSRPTTSSYLDFLGYSYASLQEVKGDIQRSHQDNLLPSITGSTLARLSIDLKAWHEALKKTVISQPSKVLQNPLKPLKGNYRNLEESKGTGPENPQHVYTAVAGPNEKAKGLYGNVEESREPTHLQNPLHPFKFLYPPVDNLRVESLTYEIFIELINKTDWHLRRLVVSLEDKLARDQKYYQVEKARIRSNITFRK